MSEQIRVEIDRDLEDLIPGFLQRLRENIQKIYNETDAGDLEQIRILGHNMKGSGGGYGFEPVTELGSAIEQSAKAGDRTAIRQHLDKLIHYIDNIEIVYV